MTARSIWLTSISALLGSFQVGVLGGGQSGVGGGPTPERALFVAQLMCRNDQPGKCVEFYANCTKPIFEEV